MALTTKDLTNGGRTAHYQFQYDDSLAGGSEPTRTNAVLAACEGDFNLMTNWFRGTGLDVDFPIPASVTQNSGGASWSISGRSLTVTINPGNGNAASVRYLLVSEMVEQFMRAHNRGWFGAGTEGSQGEGLSRFLAARFLSFNGLGNPPAGFDNSNRWLASNRLDWVNNIRAGDDGPDEVTGCSLLFIYYLFSQLGFPVDDIIAAGANTLGGVFRNLTGEITANPFPRFKRLIDSYFPGASIITGGNLDDPFPLKNLRSTPGEILWHNSMTNETQIWFWDGHRVIGRATVVGEDGRPAFVGPPWSIVGAGDFTENGVPDIIWHNSLTNETQIWFMGEGGPFNKITSRATVLGEDGHATFVGPPWSIVGTGNSLTGDEREILWHNSSTNETQVWFMSRHRVTGRATVLGEDGRPTFVGPPWSIVGTSFIRPWALGWV